MEDDSPVIPVTDVKVTDSGRATIDAKKRNRYDIEHRDAVHVTVYTDDDGQFTSTYVRVDNDGRVRIPHYHRDLFGVEDGDYIDMEVQPTGRRYSE